MAQKNAKSKRGGKRAGSGRKPKLQKKIEQTLEALLGPLPTATHEVKLAAAEAAFGVYCKILADPRGALDRKMLAAREIMNRVWGKPRQTVQLFGDVKHEVKLDLSKLSTSELDELDRMLATVAEPPADPGGTVPAEPD